MRKLVGRGLCVVLACCAWASAETLEQAVERLAKSADGVKDLYMRTTLNVSTAVMGTSIKVQGTAKLYTLRQGEKRLERMVMTAIQEVKLPGGEMPGGGKMKVTSVTVNDGKFLWAETRNPMLPKPMVMKMKIPEAGGLATPGAGGPMKGLGLGTGQADLRKVIEAMKQVCSLKLLGPGTVAGRPTTRLEATFKAEALGKMPEMMKNAVPRKMVMDWDNATGMPIGMKAINAKGKVMMRMAATEIKVNQGLDRSLFTYKPPPGVTVRDMTKQLQMPPMPAPAP